MYDLIRPTSFQCARLIRILGSVYCPPPCQKQHHVHSAFLETSAEKSIDTASEATGRLSASKSSKISLDTKSKSLSGPLVHAQTQNPFRKIYIMTLINSCRPKKEKPSPKCFFVPFESLKSWRSHQPGSGWHHADPQVCTLGKTQSEVQKSTHRRFRCVANSTLACSFKTPCFQ